MTEVPARFRPTVKPSDFIAEPAAGPDERIAVGQGEIGSAAEHGSTAIIDLPTPGYALVAAIISRNQVMGVFRCQKKVNGKPFGRRDKLICRQISEILGHSLYNVIMYINKA